MGVVAKPSDYIELLDWRRIGGTGIRILSLERKDPREKSMFLQIVTSTEKNESVPRVYGN